MNYKYDFLGYLKINNEEEGNMYLPGDYESFEFSNLLDNYLRINKDGDIIRISNKYIRNDKYSNKYFGKLKVLGRDLSKKRFSSILYM